MCVCVCVRVCVCVCVKVTEGNCFLRATTHDKLISSINTQPFSFVLSVFHPCLFFICTCESQTIVRTGLTIDRCVSARKQEAPGMICSFALTIISLSEMRAFYEMSMSRHFKGESLFHFYVQRWYCEYGYKVSIFKLMYTFNLASFYLFVYFRVCLFVCCFFFFFSFLPELD